MNIQKIVELVEIGADLGANVDVNIHDYPVREDAAKFTEELSSKLNVEFNEGGEDKAKWFTATVGGCDITVFFKK